MPHQKQHVPDTELAPLIVVSNRLPFVLKRDSAGKLRRSHRYRESLSCYTNSIYFLNSNVIKSEKKILPQK